MGLGLIRSEQLDELGNYICVESVSENSRNWLYLWATICGALAPVFGIATLILMTFDCCFNVCCSKCLQGGLFFCAIFSQGCTFLMYLSSPCYFGGNGFSCKLGYGSVFSMIAFGTYMIASMFMCFGPKHDPMCCGDDEMKEAAKQKLDEEQPAPAEEHGITSATIQPAKPDELEEKLISNNVSNEEEASPASSAIVDVTETEPLEEEFQAENEEEVALETKVKVFAKETGISTRLEENKLDASSNGLAPDLTDSVGGEDPDGEKFVGQSIKASPSLQTAPW